ncbi:hypothetical protein [Vulcanisaeta sp. JCM 14467]
MGLLQLVPTILGTTLYGGIAVAVLMHGIIKYLAGPTPDIRREGIDEIMDVVVGSAMLAILYALLESPGTFLPTLTHEIASAVPINNGTALANYLPNATDPKSMLQWGYLMARQYFDNVTAWYGHFWGGVVGLSVLPWTSPLGWYAQQSTWYLQQMITYTIINLGFIYALNLIAYNAWWLLPLGIGLVIVRQTRSIGTFIVAFLIIVAIVGPLLTAYTVAALTKPLAELGALTKGWTTDISQFVGFLSVLFNQGYQQALTMQTYDVTVDVVLAMALAASYALYRILDEVIVDVLPL